MDVGQILAKCIEDHRHRRSREAYLARTCAGNVKIREDVEALLKASAKDLGFLEPSVVTAAHPRPETASAQTPVHAPYLDQAGVILAGKYRLIELIGEGGMGSVWYAEQREPVVRKVAVKLIKAGMASKGALARFDAERQALAVMDHPNIARVYDGGVTHDGRPFFVMELVKGTPITTYCDARKLSPRERLELFMPVCRAIQHAHQKGIIHRDIKPSNVLITLYDDLPVPKVIDFGVAKATGQKLTEMTLDTGFGAVVGTPAYMSPEQASFNQLDIDTRSDVYSLGVLLYELLVGSPPFHSKSLEKAGFMEMLRVIREDEPPRPSIKLSTDEASPSISANRRTEPKSLTGLLRNELDWVVMKALEKDRARRYDTADGLALDLQRYLAGEAVAAVPPSMGYKLRKFLRRNRGPVIAVTLLLAVLLAGVIGTTWGMIAAENAAESEREAKQGEAKERKEAVKQRDRAVAAHQPALDEGAPGMRTLAATLALDNGLALCAKGDVAPGLLWLARALEMVPSEAKDLERVVRTNLGDWRHELYPLRFVFSHPDTVFSMALSPDGKTLATGCGDKRARVWDLKTGQLRFSPMEHKVSLDHVRYSPDGRWLATADVDGNIRIWDVATGQSKSPILESGEIIDTLAISPDSELLAVLDGNQTLKIWKMPRGEAFCKPFDAPGGRASNLAFRPDGKFLVVARRSQKAQIYELATQKLAGDINHPSGVIENVAFSADGKFCVSVGTGPSGQLWDAATFKALPATYTHQDLVMRVVLSPDGKVLATGSQDQTARLWNTQTGQPIGLPMPNDGGVAGLGFSGDGSKLFTASMGGSAQLWDAATGKPLGSRLHQDSLSTGVAISPDASSLITASWDGRVKVWNNTLAPRAGHVLNGTSGAIESLEFSHDGKLLAAGDFHRSVHLWDVASGKLIGKAQAETRMIWNVAFSRDSSRLASACDDGKAQLWDTKTLQRNGEPLMHQGPVNKVVFHPDGLRIFTASQERNGNKNSVHAWDLATRKRTGPELPFGGYTYDLALSPDGKNLLIASSDGAKLYAIDTGKLIADLAHNHAVMGAGFSRDNLALTCSADKTAGIWDAAGTRIHRLLHQSGLQAGAFSHQGDLAATSGTDRSAHLAHRQRRIGHPFVAPRGRRYAGVEPGRSHAADRLRRRSRASLGYCHGKTSRQTSCTSRQCSTGRLRADRLPGLRQLGQQSLLVASACAVG